MQIRHWLILGLTVILNLFLAAFGGLMLMIALNGFSEAVGGAILLAYGVWAVLVLMGAGMAQWAALKFITARPQWPLWLAGLALVVITPVVVGVALAVGVLVIMLAFGAG